MTPKNPEYSRFFKNSYCTNITVERIKYAFKQNLQHNTAQRCYYTINVGHYQLIVKWVLFHNCPPVCILSRRILVFCYIMSRIKQTNNVRRKIMVVIKTYQDKYQEQVIALISDIQQKEFNITITPDQQPDLKNISNFYQNTGNFWVALDEGSVVGTIALLNIKNNNAALRKMFVHRDYRGKEKGIAKILLETLLQWAKINNIKNIYLGTTPAFLAAHRFYEKNGFIEIPQENLPAEFPIMSVDKKFYRFTLEP